MDPAAGYKVVFFAEAEPFSEVIEQQVINMAIEYEPGGTAVFAVLEAFFQLVNKICIYVIIYFEFGITGDFDDVAHEPVEAKWCKQAGQVVAYNIFEQDNVYFAFFGR